MNKPLARAGYFLATLLVVLPFYDATTSVSPLHPGDERWRFGALGALSNLLLVPLLGILMAVAVATFADDRRIRRTLGILSGVAALITAVMAVLFVLDYFQVRTIVTPRFQHATAVASTTAVGKYVVSIITLLLLSQAGLAGPKAKTARKAVPVDPTPTPLIPMGGAARSE